MPTDKEIEAAFKAFIGVDDIKQFDAPSVYQSIIDALEAAEKVREDDTIILNKYIITKVDDEQVNITIIKDGEGGTFDLAKFEEAVDNFYTENF